MRPTLLFITVFAFASAHISFAANTLPTILVVVRVTRIDPSVLKNLDKSDLIDPNTKLGPFLNLSAFNEKGLEPCFHLSVGFLKFKETKDSLALSHKYRVIFPVTEFDCASSRLASLDVEIRNRTPQGDLFVALANVRLDKLSKNPLKLNFPSFVEGFIWLEKGK